MISITMNKMDPNYVYLVTRDQGLCKSRKIDAFKELLSLESLGELWRTLETFGDSWRALESLGEI